MIQREFENLAALAEYASRAPKYEGSAAWREETDYSWDAGATLPDAAELATLGWADGARQAKGMLDKVELTLPHETVTPYSVTYQDVQGAYVDIGLAMQGIPECMVDFREDTRRERFIDIYVAGNYAGGRGTDEIMRRGIAIAALVDALESRGVRCGVTVVTSNRTSAKGKRGLWRLDVCLKRPNDALNLDTLVFALGHPAYARRLVFAVKEREPKATELGFHGGAPYFGNYGIPHPFDAPPGALAFQSAGHDDWSEEWVKAQIQNALSSAKGC